jgi:hypothetical protein
MANYLKLPKQEKGIFKRHEDKAKIKKYKKKKKTNNAKRNKSQK